MFVLLLCIFSYMDQAAEAVQNRNPALFSRLLQSMFDSRAPESIDYTYDAQTAALYKAAQFGSALSSSSSSSSILPALGLTSSQSMMSSTLSSSWQALSQLPLAARSSASSSGAPLSALSLFALAPSSSLSSSLSSSSSSSFPSSPNSAVTHAAWQANQALQYSLFLRARLRERMAAVFRRHNAVEFDVPLLQVPRATMEPTLMDRAFMNSFSCIELWISHLLLLGNVIFLKLNQV